MMNQPTYEELKVERDRYVEHIKTLIDQRNRAFNREDDLKVLLRDIDNGIEQVLSSVGPGAQMTLGHLQDRIDRVLGPEWKKLKTKVM